METLSRPAVWIPLTALAVAVVAVLAFRLALVRFASKRESKVAASLAKHTTRPLLLLLPVLLARLVQPLLHLERAVVPTVRHAATLLLILAFGWLLISLITVLDESLREHSVAGVHDASRAKRMRTRAGIFRQVLTTVILVLTAAGMMATFEEGRAIGASVLASAGIAALVLGIAARPTLENLIAGLRVEEITNAYVVVRIWDRRRLIVPLGYFLEKPFQNWTRSGTDLLAQVTLEVDYSTPIETVREEAGRIVTGSKLWDGGFGTCRSRKQVSERCACASSRAPPTPTTPGTCAAKSARS
jgi:small-conductance mechanosensitive channel